MQTNVNKETANATVRSLASDVAKLTGQTVDQVLPFATKFGPLAAKWEAERAVAKSGGDRALIERGDEDRRQLRTAALLQAGRLGVRLHQTMELRFLEAIDRALKVG